MKKQTTNTYIAACNAIGLKVDFLDKEPDNVYRTKKYIVAQHVSLAYDEAMGAVSVSEDFFYERNPQRDSDFDFIVEDQRYPNGRRVPTQSHVRTYVR